MHLQVTMLVVQDLLHKHLVQQEPINHQQVNPPVLMLILDISFQFQVLLIRRHVLLVLINQVLVSQVVLMHHLETMLTQMHPLSRILVFLEHTSLVQVNQVV
jgi:hypothetical protein